MMITNEQLIDVTFCTTNNISAQLQIYRIRILGFSSNYIRSFQTAFSCRSSDQQRSD